MTIKLKNSGWPERREVLVSSAIDIILDGRDYGSGQVESAARTADNATAFIGKLVEVLAEKQILSREELLSLLGYGWEFED